MQKSFNHFLDDVKAEYEQAKQKRLVSRRQKQRLMFIFLANLRVFSYENDFGQSRER